MKKKSLLLICLFLFANYLYSQERTILLMEGDTGYKSQSWFYCGHGNELDLNQIAAAWNEGKRIISAAYTEKGWFVTMAKNTGYTMQTYHYATDWPTNWIKEKQSKGYDITSVSTGKGKWFIVMSRGTSYTDQTWNWETWTAMSKFIKSQWDNNYYITQTTYFKGKWLVIMSKNSPYSAQGYFWCNTSDELKEKMEEKWQSNYNILLINYGDGEYFVIYGKYKKIMPGRNITK